MSEEGDGEEDGEEDGRRTGGGGGRRGVETELKTKTQHVNVGKTTYRIENWVCKALSLVSLYFFPSRLDTNQVNPQPLEVTVCS